jgi:hypothetical protein
MGAQKKLYLPGSPDSGYMQEEEEAFSGGGEQGDRIRRFDSANTPMGAIST